MNYKEEFLKDLRLINIKIDNNEILGTNNALELFKKYVVGIIILGRFSTTEWRRNWRKEVYTFGEKFKELDPVEFLKVIHNTKATLEKDEKEVLEFFKSEIIINNQPFEDCLGEIKKLISEYPYNPEFRHNLGHLFKNKNEKLKAIEQYTFALNKDKSCTFFARSLFNTQYRYTTELINKNDYLKAEKYCQKIIEKKTFKSSYVFSNLLVSLKDRIEDYLTIEKKIKIAEENFKVIVKTEIERERKRLIEILGFYSAIIAFIFSTVSIAKNFKFEEALIFIICLGIILILFLNVISILFSQEKIEISNPKFLIPIILILTLVLILTKFTIPFWS